MAGKIRSFIAVELSEGHKKLCQEIQFQLEQSGADVRWIDPAKIHLTLKFLGDINTVQIEGVKNLLKDLVRSCAPTIFQLTQLGAFPDSQSPRIIWIGADNKDGQIKKWAEQLNERSKSLGVAKED